MKKQEKISNEDIITRLFETQYKYLYNSTLITIKFYESCTHCLLIRISLLEEEEPPKFFKKTHKKWEIDLEQLRNEYDRKCEILVEEYKELEKLIDMVN